jgi:hypothetical protein
MLTRPPASTAAFTNSGMSPPVLPGLNHSESILLPSYRYLATEPPIVAPRTSEHHRA